MLIRTITNVVFILPEDAEAHERFLRENDMSKWNGYFTTTTATYSTSNTIITEMGRNEDD